MALRILAGSDSRPLASGVTASLRSEPVACELERFPDGELRPTLGALRGDDVYVVCSTGPPVDAHLMELALLLDAARRGGAGRLTAVVPYFGYARQDRRTRPGEPIGSRLAAEVIAVAGAERLVVVDPHAAGFEAACPVPTEVLRAGGRLAAAVAAAVPGPEVVVAPDLGAVRLAERFAAALALPVAFVRKRRLSGTEVEASDLVGEVDGRQVVVVDDMISTGGTTEAAARLCAARGAAPGTSAVATHGLFVAGALQRLTAAGIGRLVVTDSLAPPPGAPAGLQVCSIAPLLAEAIGRLHREEPPVEPAAAADQAGLSPLLPGAAEGDDGHASGRRGGSR